MIENMFMPIPEKIHNLDIPNYLTPTDYEIALQSWTGLEGNPQEVRSYWKNRLIEEDNDIMYQGSELALQQGADSQIVADTVKNYIGRPVTEDNSLEIAATEKVMNDGLMNDDITYNNLQDPDTDLDEFSDNGSISLLTARTVEDIRKTGPGFDWNLIGTAMLSGAENDLLVIDDMKKAIPQVPWSNEVTWEDMQTTFDSYVKNISDTQGITGITALYKNLKDRATAMDNHYMRYKVADLIAGTAEVDDIANAIGLGLDVATGLKAAAKGAKFGGDKTTVLNYVANSKDITELNSSFVKKAATGDHLINYSNDPVITGSLKETAADKRVKQIIDLYHNEMPQTLSKEDVENVVNRTYHTDFDRHYVDVTDMTQDGDSVKATVLIGNGVDNQAAMTKQGVDNLAKELGIKDYKAVRKDGAGYYLQTTIKEPGQLDKLSTEEFGANAFGRMFGGSSIMPEWFHTELLAGYRKASKMEETLYNEYQKSARNLGKADRIKLNDIYLAGQRADKGRGAWIDVNKMYDRGEISKKVRDAYINFRKVNDMDYIISNANTWEKLNKLGYVSDLDDDIVKVIKEGMLKTPNYSQMVIKNGDKTITATTHSAQQVEELLKNSGNVLVEVAPISVKGHALPYTHKIISPDKLTNQLKKAVLPYRAGGRRRYAYGTNFLKIGQTMQLNGEKVNAYSRIIGATANEKIARETADELNRALGYIERMVESSDTAEVAAELVRNPFKYINVSNTDDLKKLGEGLDYTQRVQVLKEGESMVYNNGLRTLYEDPLDYDTAFAEMALVQGNFYSKRGSVLTDFLGKEAKLMDIQDMFDQVVKRAATNNALGSLYEGMGRIFKDRYLELIDTNTIRNPRTLSGVDLLRYGKLREFSEVNAIHHQALREAKNMQLIYKRMANVQTDTDKAINSTMKSVANTLSKTHVFNEKQLEWVAKNDPFTYGRALLFQTTMGMFNLKQLWAQGMGAISMGFAHPLLLSRALLSAPVMIAGYLSKDSAVMRGMFKSMAVPFGISNKTFDDIIRYFEEYGTTMGTYRSPMTEILHINKYVDKVGQVLRWPVEWGTNYANVVNDLAAYFEAGGKNWKKIAARADDFAMNQTRATRSAFQAGQHLPTKTVAQFTSWPHRVLESAFNKRLTTREKVGIMLGQVALWGAVATAFSDSQTQMNANMWLREHTEFMPDELRNLFLDGAIKSFLVSEGLYAQEGIGGAGILDVASTLTNIFLTNDTKDINVEIPGGFKAPTRLGKALQSAMWMAGIGLNDSEDYTPYHVAKKIAMEPEAPSGLRNISKFILGYYFQEAYSTNGKMVTDNVTKEQARGMLFGLSLSQSAQAQALYLIHNNAEKAIRDFYDDMVGKELRGWNPGDAPEVKREKMNRLKEHIITVRKFAHTYGVDGDNMFRRIHQSAIRSANMSGEQKNIRNTKRAGNGFIQDLLNIYINTTQE
jgi:hypothetical protein